MSDDLNSHDAVQEGATSENQELNSEVSAEVVEVDYKTKFEEAQAAAEKKEELLSRAQTKLRKKDKLIREQLEREAQISSQVDRFNEGELESIDLKSKADYTDVYTEHFGWEGSPPEDFLKVAEDFGATKADIAQFRRDWTKENPSTLTHIYDETMRRREMSAESAKDKEIAELKAQLAAKADAKSAPKAAKLDIPEPLSSVSGLSDTESKNSLSELSVADITSMSTEDLKAEYKKYFK